MLGLLFTIIIIVLILSGVIFYVNKKNTESDNYLIKQLNSASNFRSNALNHITNALKEIDVMGKKYKYLGSNNNSICYRKKGEIIDGCECHPSCKTCGYSDNPVGINQCLKCNNGTEVNRLYQNGAGWCGSFNEDGNTGELRLNEDSGEFVTPDIETTITDISQNVNTLINNSNENSMATTNQECSTRFNTMCPSSSSWKECLERNNTSLLLSGCKITIDDDNNVTAELSNTARRSQQSTSETSTTTTTSEIGAVKKDMLKYNDVLLTGEYLESPNMKFKLYITRDGQVMLRNAQTSKIEWTSNREPGKLTTRLGPYKLKYLSSNILKLLDKNDIEVWNASPTTTAVSGVNSKVSISDTGALEIKDSAGSIIWTSATTTASATSSSSSSTSSSSSSSSSTSSSSSSSTPISSFIYQNVFGITNLKFNKCPSEYPYKASDSLGNNKGCSKFDNIATNRENSCALQGYYTGTNDSILPRCYDKQVGLKDDGSYVKCPTDNGVNPQRLTGIGDKLHKYVMVSKNRCAVLKDNTAIYDSRVNTIPLTSAEINNLS